METCTAKSSQVKSRVICRFTCQDTLVVVLERQLCKIVMRVHAAVKTPVLLSRCVAGRLWRHMLVAGVLP